MKRLITLRQEANLSQTELAEKLNVTQQTISKYENGTRVPDSDMLKKLSTLFNVSIDYLLENENKPTDEITDLLETLHKRPEMKTLFSLSKNATKQDIERAIKIIEALKDR